MPYPRRDAGAKRPTIWARTVAQGFGIPTGGLHMIGLLTAIEGDLGAQMRNSTIRRIIGNVWYHTDAAINGPELFAMGIIRVTQSAFTAGVGAMPDPGLAFHADWMFYAFAATDEEGVGTAPLHHTGFDLRTGRKMSEVDAVVAFIVKNATSSAMRMGYDFKLLLMLP